MKLGRPRTKHLLLDKNRPLQLHQEPDLYVTRRSASPCEIESLQNRIACDIRIYHEAWCGSVDGCVWPARARFFWWPDEAFFQPRFLFIPIRLARCWLVLSIGHASFSFLCGLSVLLCSPLLRVQQRKTTSVNESAGEQRHLGRPLMVEPAC